LYRETVWLLFFPSLYSNIKLGEYFILLGKETILSKFKSFISANYKGLKAYQKFMYVTKFAVI
jgi:hypothetical protein